MCRTKVVSGKRRVDGVMANAGFGDLLIKTPEGLSIHIPQNRIAKKEGGVYKHVQKLLNKGRNNGYTRELAEELEERGIKIYVTGGKM